MKKLNGSLLLVLTSILLLTSSCKKDDDNNDGINIGSDGCNASWKVDGTSYNSDNMSGCIYLDNTLNLATSITGGDFFLQIDPITAKGSFAADPNSADPPFIILLTLNNGTVIGPAAGATVVVSELSNSKAKGTFSGNFFDISDINFDPVFSVTDGKFEADF